MATDATASRRRHGRGVGGRACRRRDKRTAALKLPRAEWIDQGLSERIARERAILARLQHPHIAVLYDAGLGEGGRPYLALEYVDGIAIDAYCTGRDLKGDSATSCPGHPCRRVCPCAAHHPSRPEAGQRSGHRRWIARAARLRYLQADRTGRFDDGRDGADQARRPPVNARLCRARAGAGVTDHGGGRCVCARGDAVRVAHGVSFVSRH